MYILTFQSETVLTRVHKKTPATPDTTPRRTKGTSCPRSDTVSTATPPEDDSPTAANG